MLNLSKQQPKHNNKDCFSKNRSQFYKKGKPAGLPFFVVYKIMFTPPLLQQTP